MMNINFRSLLKMMKVGSNQNVLKNFGQTRLNQNSQKDLQFSNRNFFNGIFASNKDPVKVKNSIGDGFTGASISIGEKDKESTHEVKAYQTSIWHKTSKVHLSEFNLKSLTFNSAVDEAVQVEDVKQGQYTFRNPFLIGKDHIQTHIQSMIQMIQLI